VIGFCADIAFSYIFLQKLKYNKRRIW
jgi:hypothetical protein